MDTPRKLIIGYDLCEDVTQISCYSYKKQEPITIGQTEEDYSPIPTVLCIKQETKQWLFGEEAKACAAAGEGSRIDSLLDKIITGEEVTIFNQKFNGILLLEKFLRKTLMLVKNYFPTEPITKLVVTVRDTQPVLVEGIYQALSMLGIDKDRAVVMGHAGAYLYYVLSQERSLWLNDVGLFDFSTQGLSYYQISFNRRTKPIVASLSRKDLTEQLSYDMLDSKEIDIEYVFKTLADTLLFKQIISTLYFTGKGFEGGWAEEVIKSLCTGRRAFLGQNLYMKGACYAAKELSGDRMLENYILLNDEMITSSIWIRLYADAKMTEVPLTEAAIPWYEVNKSIEVIAEDEAEIALIIKNIMTREILCEKLVPSHLPERPKRMTRLEINLTCTSSSKAKLTVTDRGFGAFYPETGRVWEFLLEI
ncbi:MAG: hypothetical protein E7255_05225 [Lachnospiraceae bacterium]|jgi:hypothetical protein|nr:hypothetical protein [Lachnospiraceae bacterium]